MITVLILGALGALVSAAGMFARRVAEAWVLVSQAHRVTKLDGARLRKPARRRK